MNIKIFLVLIVNISLGLTVCPIPSTLTQGVDYEISLNTNYPKETVHFYESSTLYGEIIFTTLSTKVYSDHVLYYEYQTIHDKVTNTYDNVFPCTLASRISSVVTSSIMTQSVEYTDVKYYFIFKDEDGDCQTKINPFGRADAAVVPIYCRTSRNYPSLAGNSKNY